jgi:hypothetical protein
MSDISICDRQSKYRAIVSIVLLVSRIHGRYGLYQQSLLSAVALNGSGSSYLVTWIYWVLWRRYHGSTNVDKPGKRAGDQKMMRSSSKEVKENGSLDQ